MTATVTKPRYAVRYPVDDPGGRLAEKTVPALDAHRPHDVVPLVDGGHDAGDLLRGVLEVRIERDDDLPTGRLEARHDRHVLTEVAVEVDEADHVGPQSPMAQQEGKRRVPAAVVYEDDLVGAPHPVQDGEEAREEVGEALLLVVDGDDHRDVRATSVYLLVNRDINFDAVSFIGMMVWVLAPLILVVAFAKVAKNGFGIR